MKNLLKWQIISFISRGLALFLGLIQSFVILRILSQGEWGIVQLATSIGGALGIYQHLGLASASTREISAVKDDTKIFKIFVTSAVIRYFVTLPLSIILILLSGKIATDLYHHPELAFPLKIYGFTMLAQGIQSILNSVISGTKRFKHLFIYQVAISVVSVVIFIPLVYFYRVTGYFYAFFLFNVISSVVLTILAFKPLHNKLVFPSFKDFKVLLKEIFSISIAIYVVKIIYTNWEKFGTNILGLYNPAEVIAIYGFAALFAKKILSISDSVTDVNLPVLSEKFVDDLDDFKKTFSKNFDKVFVFIILSASVACFWAPEIIRFAVGTEKYLLYLPSLPLILPLLISFILYSFIDIAKSSVLIPAKMTSSMLLSFLMLLVASAIPFGVSHYLKLNPLYSMAWSMVIGTFFTYLFMLFTIKKKLDFDFINIDHLMVFIQFVCVGFVSTTPVFWIKLITFPLFIGFVFWGEYVSGFVTKHELVLVKNKILEKLKR